MVYIPKDVPRNREELLAFLAQKTSASHVQVQHEEAMTELHYTPEIQLLHEVLMDNSTQLEILKPFYTLCLHLLSSSNVQTPAELKAELGLHDHHRQKRCLDLTTDPFGKNCSGMCGAGNGSVVTAAIMKDATSTTCVVVLRGLFVDILQSPLQTLPVPVTALTRNAWLMRMLFHIVGDFRHSLRS